MNSVPLLEAAIVPEDTSKCFRYHGTNTGLGEVERGISPNWTEITQDSMGHESISWRIPPERGSALQSIKPSHNQYQFDASIASRSGLSIHQDVSQSEISLAPCFPSIGNSYAGLPQAFPIDEGGMINKDGILEHYNAQDSSHFSSSQTLPLQNTVGLQNRQLQFLAFAAPAYKNNTAVSSTTNDPFGSNGTPYIDTGMASVPYASISNRYTPAVQALRMDKPFGTGCVENGRKLEGLWRPLFELPSHWRPGLCIAGDFNSTPTSAVYQLLSQGTCDRRHPDLLTDRHDLLSHVHLGHSLSLKSSHAEVRIGVFVSVSQKKIHRTSLYQLIPNQK